MWSRLGKSRRMLVLVLSVVLLMAMCANTALATVRPLIRGTNGMVACGHYLAAHIGNTILLKGGNAFDANAAMLLAQSLLEHQSYGFGGEVPILVYSADNKKVFSIDGNTAAPKSVDVQWFIDHGVPKIPGQGLLSMGVPAVLDAIILMLDEFGTMSFTEVAADPIKLAEGFPMWESYQGRIASNEDRFRNEWPGSAELFLPDGKVPQLGEVFANQDLADLWKKLSETERAALAAGKSRSEALTAVRDRFYKGDIAETYVKYVTENKFMIDDLGEAYPANLTMEDMATYTAKIREPWRIDYKGYEVYKCGPWTQGPVFLIQLKLLEQFDLQKIGYGTADYWHIMAETMKLAHADKIEWLGDDDFIAVPMAGLLSDEYAKERVKLIDMNKAMTENIPGDPWKYNDVPKPETYPYLPGGYVPAVKAAEDTDFNLDPDQMVAALAHVSDTTGTRAVDRWGNIFSATPSGGWFHSNPIVPGLGFCPNSRIQMFYVDRTDHARSYVPGARPSTSLTPTLVTKDGKPFLGLGMPGGDQQDQVTLQDFIHVVDFGANIQEATEMQHLTTNNMPSLFYPHEMSMNPGRITLPASVSDEVIKELEARGHKIGRTGFPSTNATMVMIDPVTGVLYGAASPGSGRYAIGW